MTEVKHFACYQNRAHNMIKTKSLAIFSAFVNAFGFGRLAILLFDTSGFYF